MLTAIAIRDLVLIDALDLEVGAGFTALTGETGAGKSILLDGLRLATGARAERTLVRAGAERAMAQASFRLTPDHPIFAHLAERGVSGDETGELTVKRVIGQDGRGRAFINDEPVSAALLKEIGDQLLEVHGQHDGSALFQPLEHRRLLDAYGGLESLRAQCGAAWHSLIEARAEVERLERLEADVHRERDYAAFALSELERLDPRDGEEAAIAAQRAFLSSMEKTADALKDAQSALAEHGGVEARLAAAARAMSKVAHAAVIGGPAAAALAHAAHAAAHALDRAIIETNEAQAQIGACARDLDYDERALETLEERLFALRAAARKYAVPADDLPVMRQRFAEKLAAIEGVGEALQAARARAGQALQVYGQAASALTAGRRAAGARLDAAVMSELPALKLERALFRTAVEPVSADKSGPHGQDRVEFEVATNPGAPFGGLGVIASGGELARFSLALKVSLAREIGTPVMIFDEVDQGVGGAVADAIGARLAELAKSTQVLAVTHSAQVSARAHQHWKIAKSSRGETMLTQVRDLNLDERLEEVARMLSGAEISPEARAAAGKLLGLG